LYDNRIIHDAKYSVQPNPIKIDKTIAMLMQIPVVKELLKSVDAVDGNS